jgi:hypothetical protein
MRFDFDLYAPALWTLSNAFDEAARKSGISRSVLTKALFRHSAAQGGSSEANLWKHADSQETLGKWIYRRNRGRFDSTHEGEILKLAESIPIRIRRNLIEIAKTLAAPKGGNPPKLDLLEMWQVRREFDALRKDGVAKDQAYRKISQRRSRDKFKISAHTIRRVCEPKERERSLRRVDKGIAFFDRGDASN